MSERKESRLRRRSICALPLAILFLITVLTTTAAAQVTQPSPFESAPEPPSVSPEDITREAPLPPKTVQEIERLMREKTAEEKPEKQPPTLIGLVQAFEEALVQHPRVASVRAQLGIARALYARALTFPNPAFLFFNDPIAEQTQEVGASISIEAPWKVVLRLITAKRQVKQTDLEIMNALWLLRSDVRRSYLDVVLARETAETLYELSALSRQLLRVAEKRFQAGDVPELDVLKARLATSQADIEFYRGVRRIVQAKQQLNLMLGRTHEAAVDVPRLPSFPLKGRVEQNVTELLPDLEKPVPPLNDFVKQAMDSRLEIKIVKQAMKVNQAGLATAYGNIVPNFQLNVGASETGNPPTGPKITGGRFIGITQEIPVGNFQQGDIMNYKATLKQLKFEIHAQKNLIMQQVSAAYQKLLAAREAIRAYQEHVLFDSNEVARLARRSYEVGQADITATLAAQQANVQIRSQYLDAVRTYQEAFTDLERSVGQVLQ